MKIIKLRAENVKRLKAVEITPEGNVVIIGGMNDQGKTSTIDSIAMAFAGKRAIPSQPIRKGAKKATVICETEDLIVTRTMTQKGGGTLKVSTKDGKNYSTPQAVLDALTGQLTFDPLAFARMDKRKQLETLKALVGLDFTDMDAERSRLYEERTEINREQKRLSGHLESMSSYPDAPKEEVSVSELMDELNKRESHNRNIENDKRSLENFKSRTVAQREHIDGIDKEIGRLQQQMLEKKRQKTDLELSIKDREKITTQKEQVLNGLVEADTKEIKDQISTAQEINSQVRTNKARQGFEKQMAEHKKDSGALTASIDEIDRKKSETLSAVKFPIPGLSFDETGVTFKDIPFDQLSSSEQLKVSTAMGFAMNPKLKILLIRDGSLLDEKNLKLMAEMAEKEDGQVWLERVGEGQEVSVIIEDGEIKERSEE